MPRKASSSAKAAAPKEYRTVSIVIPVYNESENLPQLFEKLDALIRNQPGNGWEVVLIDDGSKDNSAELILEKAKVDEHYVPVLFKRNFGQTAAMQAGFDHATGDVVVPMDADLQNDPDDIPMLLEKLDEGYDVVSGWRLNRQDKPIRRVFVSRVANWIISKISGVELHDYGCSLKAYRKEVMADVRLYGEMHRFIPIYAFWQGGRITEIPVRHYARTKGVSKYGMNRIFKVILDLIVVKFLHGYSQKPMYVFGGFGLICFVLSFLFGALAVGLKLGDVANLSRTPLPLASLFFGLIGVFSMFMGLLAEIITRTYYESQDKRTYTLQTIPPKSS
ncbi:MAG: glycosyltransferase family 2 protein [Opitutales bacterium]|nr:glycosyltransferase family 2 protein [Opitutales bacterium]